MSFNRHLHSLIDHGLLCVNCYTHSQCDCECNIAHCTNLMNSMVNCVFLFIMPGAQQQQ